MKGSAVFLGAAVLVASTSCRAPAVASEAPVDASLRHFDEVASGPDAAARLEAARRALEEARKLRDRLEAGKAPAGLEYAAGEQLVYANHLVAGLALFVHSDGGEAALESLRSILARGRIHRDRGRAALKSAPAS